MTYIKTNQQQIENLPEDLADRALKTVKIDTGAGLTGGGDLTEDRELKVKFGTTPGTVSEGDHTHDFESYLSGTNELLEIGVDIEDRVWSAKVLKDSIQSSAGGLQEVTDRNNITTKIVQSGTIDNHGFVGNDSIGVKTLNAGYAYFGVDSLISSDGTDEWFISYPEPLEIKATFATSAGERMAEYNGNIDLRPELVRLHDTYANPIVLKFHHTRIIFDEQLKAICPVFDISVTSSDLGKEVTISNLKGCALPPINSIPVFNRMQGAGTIGIPQYVNSGEWARMMVMQNPRDNSYYLLIVERGTL